MVATELDSAAAPLGSAGLDTAAC